jgi:hypothetical protein
MRYLLGSASEEERAAVEAEYFAGDEGEERLDAAEDQLFGDYAAGRLSAADQAAFRQRYLSSPEGRRRLVFARALRQRSNAEAEQLEGGALGPAAGPRGAWVAAAAALIIAAGSVLWLARQNAQLRREVEGLRAERHAAAASPSPGHPNVPSPAPAGDAVRSVRLPTQPPAAPVNVAFDASTRSIRLEVPLTGEEDSATFGVVIRRPGGEEVWRQEGLVPQRYGEPLVAVAPAELLAEGEYVLSIEGEPSRDAPEQFVRRYRLRLRAAPPR